MDATLLKLALDRHAAALALYVRQWTVAPEDIVQETFVKLALLEPPPEPIAPWLFRVARNLALNAVRSAKRRRLHEARAAQQKEIRFIAPVETALDAATVSEWLQALPAEQREVITLHLWGGLTFAEIAAVMDASAGGVHRWYQVGLEALRGRVLPCRRE